MQMLLIGQTVRKLNRLLDLASVTSVREVSMEWWKQKSDLEWFKRDWMERS